MFYQRKKRIKMQSNKNFLNLKYRITYYGGLIFEKFIQNQKLSLEISPTNQEFFLKLIKEQKLKFENISQEINEKFIGMFSRLNR